VSGSGNQPDTSDFPSSERIDLACDAFEAIWGKGERPRIEDYLEQEPLKFRDRMLRELLEIELELRQRNGEMPVEDEYYERFPDHREMIDGLFGKVVERTQLGDYALLRELGRGGMGVVYKARHVLLNQIVAVKVLTESYLGEPKAVSRFRREMRSIGALNHPNIVAAHNAGQEGNTHYLVMEFVDGVNLHQLVRRRGPLPVGTACELICQAAKGLAHAHEHGLVHRDIKPANLMLSRYGVVKILDLGLARLHVDREFLPRLTQTGLIVGTVGYMAPEQTLDSSSVDIRADIYSLGCTLFYLLTAGPPYGDESCEMTLMTLRAHAIEPIPSLSACRPDCPRELDDILHRMLAKQPKDRYAAPAEVVAALRPLADPAGLDEPLPPTKAGDEASTVTDGHLTSSDVDTHKKQMPGVKPGYDATTQILGKPARRVKGLRLWAALAAAAAAGAIAAAGTAAWWFTR
jgi:serine/threonine protein kinase